jgi:signal transduction histidine kinase
MAMRFEKLQSLLGVMDRSANRLTSFIDDFLDLSKLNKESLSVTQEPIALKDILGEVVENQKILADEKGLEFSIDDAGCIDVNGDPVVIRTLCQNLLNNAIKYTSEGSVKVRVLSDADTFTFEVEDTGSGLTDEEQKNLFQEYGRIRRTKGVKGTGLGLALVKKLIDACRGSISVHSDGKDKGCIFAFTLPRVFGEKKSR